MPNHVTTRIKAPEHVIQALVSDNRIDFETLIPYPGKFDWNGVSGSAETLAEKAVGGPVSENPLLASLQLAARDRADIKALSDDEFEQFVQMLRNHRSTGFFHQMDFAREKWGTKWNAYESVVDAAAGIASFDTAWSFPEPVITALSERFPDYDIAVEYADEDIGSNCGKLLFRAGKIVERDVAGDWSESSEEERKRWSDFAYAVKGWDPEDD